MISGILYSLSRLSLNNVQGTTRTITTNTLPLYFNATPTLWGEPMKKKKRLDPAIIRRRLERKAKKIQQQIKRLEKGDKILKPVFEMQLPKEIYAEKKLRVRKQVKISEEVATCRRKLRDQWAHYKLLEYKKDMEILETMQNSQEKALKALRKESEELYQEAIQLDLTCLPYKTTGPTITPPIENYNSPDGDYINITRKFEGE